MTENKMAKNSIHIALVGGQPAPVFYGIHQLFPERTDPEIILICSKSSKPEAERLSALLKENSFRVTIKEFEPYNLQAIDKSIAELKNHITPADSVSLNLVEGTKPWSILFYEAFKNRENTELYLTGQNNFIWNLINKDCKPMEMDIDIDEHLQLYDNTISDYKTFDSYTEEDLEAIKTISEIRNRDRNAFNHLCAILRDDNQKKFQESKNTQKKESIQDSRGNAVSWIYPDWVELHFIDGSYKKEITSANAVDLAFNSGWFEFKVAKLIKNWNNCKEIRMNCVFKAKAKNSETKNEIDIIANAGRKLFFIECKTSVHNSTDIDKFCNAVKTYGGLGSKSIFITETPMDETCAEKCRQSKIATFSLKNSRNRDNDIKQLYNLLNEELETINIR